MFFCDCVMKEYGFDFLIHEKYALWHKKLISKQELLDKYEEVSKVLKEFHEVVAPYKTLLDDFSNKLMEFDRNHNKTYCWEEE